MAHGPRLQPLGRADPGEGRTRTLAPRTRNPAPSASASSSILGSGRGSNVTRCDPRLVALMLESNCTTSTCLLTNSGGAFRPGTRSHPGTATRSAAPTSTGGYPFSRRPMLPSWRCSTPRQIQTDPTTRRGALHAGCSGTPRNTGEHSRALVRPHQNGQSVRGDSERPATDCRRPRCR
jgi:hypothetical protein